jgi:hypothetical protein
MRLCALAWLMGTLLIGCESPKSVRHQDTPQTEPSPFKKIGTITQVDKGSATVIVRLNKTRTAINTELYVRNTQLQVTALIKPSGLRTGLSVGMVILRGDPKSGEEVFERIIP